MSSLGRRSEAGVITPRATTPERPRRRGTTFARLIGALGMISLTVVLFWLLTDDSFRITEASVTFEGLEHADEAAVRTRLSGIERAPNVFRVRAADIVGDVSALPDVDAASASVTLPAAITVRVEEREPLFVWSHDGVAWMVDEAGMLFGPTGFVEVEEAASSTKSADAEDDEVTAGTEAATSAPASLAPASIGVDAEAVDLPLVIDARLQAEPPGVGSHLPAQDLAVLRPVLAHTPEALGGRSEDRNLRVDENLGYVLHSDLGWSAFFGRYSPRVQPIEAIPRQVQCLRALLRAEERRLERVWLSLSEDGCGTFTKRERAQ
jgi:hypothetical protein